MPFAYTPSEVLKSPRSRRDLSFHCVGESIWSFLYSDRLVLGGFFHSNHCPVGRKKRLFSSAARRLDFFDFDHIRHV